MSNALAQEKTGEFWVDGQLFGRSRCHTTPDFERAEVAMFVGKNPWESHGFPRSRVVLKEIAKDPERALVVIDPRRTKTAQIADFHLQVRPGTDAFCLSALLGVLVQEGLLDEDFLADHAAEGERVLGVLRDVPVPEYAARCGVDEELIRATARRLASAGSVAVLEDLGIQQAPHSTLNSYLEKLLFLLTGNFGRAGTMNIHTGIASLGGDFRKDRTTPVSGARIITGLIPSNTIADEILTDDPARLRAMIVESSNPVHSVADSPRMREALERLDLLVVFDVALTETARLADYVLPVALAVREVGGELLLPRVPEERLPAAPADPGPAARERPASRAGDPPPARARDRRARRRRPRRAARARRPLARGVRRRRLRPARRSGPSCARTCR